MVGEGPVLGGNAAQVGGLPPEGVVDGWWKQWVEVGQPLRINALQVRFRKAGRGNVGFGV